MAGVETGYEFNSEDSSSGSLFYLMDSLHEFGPTFSARLKRLTAMVCVLNVSVM
jgi:hypothetical protein